MDAEHERWYLPNIFFVLTIRQKMVAKSCKNNIAKKDCDNLFLFNKKANLSAFEKNN